MNTTSSARRAQQERAARVILYSGLAPVLPCAAVVIWALGYKHVLAYVTAAIAAVIGTSFITFVYRLNMKRARQL